MNNHSVCVLQGVQYLLDNDLLDETPEAVAEFLYKEDGLNKTAIGNFLGERYSDFTSCLYKPPQDYHQLNSQTNTHFHWVLLQKLCPLNSWTHIAKATTRTTGVMDQKRKVSFSQLKQNKHNNIKRPQTNNMQAQTHHPNHEEVKTSES